MEGSEGFAWLKFIQPNWTTVSEHPNKHCANTYVARTNVPPPRGNTFKNLLSEFTESGGNEVMSELCFGKLQGIFFLNNCPNI